MVSKYDGTHGFRLRVDSSGRLIIRGDGTSNREYTSNRSLPLGQWVHVAATLDMATPSCTMYFDGVPGYVPVSTGSTGTSLTQAGNLEIGAANDTDFFDGEIADVRIWSAVRTQQNILDNMHKRLTGSETNLVAYFKLSGDFNDSTSNANNLTAQGGAAATTADCPFASTEWAIIHKVEYATGNTTITVFTGQHLAPAENLANVSYSSADSPVGFPKESNKWSIIFIDANSHTASTGPSWVNTGGMKIVAATGSWKPVFSGSLYATRAQANIGGVKCTLSTANNTESNLANTVWADMNAVGATTTAVNEPFCKVLTAITCSTQTPLYVNFWCT
ncbi:MAG TPA: LamG domain-containing protein, partial [Candidatus Saccharimonadales bacterium]|nr:LamG domain-containing protein [Candidatus Saccharimonadales bacterium]